MKEDKGALRILYFTTALQYHDAARYAAFAGFNPVCGILFHHAVEMYLKGYLCQSMDEAQRKALHHNLRKTWDRFNLEVQDQNLSRFEPTIDALDRHEALRYPEETAKHGMQVCIVFESASVSTGVCSPLPVSEPYMINVDEMDALCKIIATKSGLSARAFTARRKNDAEDFLNLNNKSPLS